MRRDDKAAYAGVTTITKGVHSSTAPIALPPNQLAWATNLDCRSDFMRPRAGWVKRPLTFLGNSTTDPVIEPLDVQALFEDAIFEGAIVFERYSQIVTMIGGHLFRIDPAAWTVRDVTPLSSTAPPIYAANAANRYRAWFCEAENWVIAQDGNSIPWIYDGTSAVRSDTLGSGGKPQVPIGKAMCYSQGRLIVSYASGRAFVVGDIVGGDSGTAAFDFKDSVLYFTENDVINGGGSFSVPINAGLLTAFRPIAQIDTSMGQGPTQVFTTGAIFSLNLPVDRTTWQTVNFPIGTVSNVANGMVSDRCTPNVNGDIWGRAPDGWRAFLVARRDFQAAWVNAPLSQEVSRAVDTDDQHLLSYASASHFDNRLLGTTRPYRVWEHGIVHEGFVQLDFQPVATLSERNPLPTWLGLATGVRVLQVVSGNIAGIPRCFVFALSADNRIELWEVTRFATADSTATSEVPIAWSFETAAFPFTAAATAGAPALPGRELWSLDGGRLYVDDIQGDVSFAFQFRPDQDPCWHDWHSWTVCANTAFCPPIDCECPGRPQYRRPFFLPQPRAGCDPATDKPYHICREVQVRGVIVGHCRVKMLELVSHVQEEDVTGVCAGDEQCVLVSCLPPNDYAYLIESSPVTGACCVGTDCSVTTRALCTELGGTYLGDGTDCEDAPCGEPPPTPTGACCVGEACSVTTEAACLEAGGTYLGDSTDCSGTPCAAPPTPTGACCADGLCTVITQEACAALGGVYQGDDSTCTLPTCEPPTPAWPTPDPYDCAGRDEMSAIEVEDPVTLVSRFVGINPGGGDPNAYLVTFGAAGCLEAWSAEVWSQFIALGIPFSKARLIWKSGNLTGSNYQGQNVFPDELGNYPLVGSLTDYITVEWCPVIT